MSQSEPFGFPEARLRCSKYLPYFYHHVASLIPVERPGLGTMSVDRHMRVYYDPAVFDQWTIDQCTGAILHEDLHVLLGHHRRAGEYLGADPGQDAWLRWNVACDLVVNQTLAKVEKLPLPDDWLSVADYGFPENLSVEEYYELLEARDEQPPQLPQDEDEDEPDGTPGDPSDTEDTDSGADSGEDSGESQDPDQDAGEASDETQDGDQQSDECSGDGQESGEPSDGGQDSGERSDGGQESDDPSEDGTPGDGPGEGSPENQTCPDSDGGGGLAPGEPYDGDQHPQPGQGSGGSGADGQPKPWECPPPEQCDTPGMDDYDQAMIERTVAEAIARYEREKGHGTVPGSLARFAEEKLRPKVDPFRALHAAVKYAVTAINGRGDYTWRRLPRRTPPGGLRLAAPVKPVPRATVIVDTSGSMSARELAKALGVIELGLRSVPAEGIRVMAGDTCARSAKRVFRPEQVELLGGGGTNMAALVEQAAEERPRPDAIVVVTDGWTRWPSERVRPRVVACLTAEPPDAYRVPEWITKVVLKD